MNYKNINTVINDYLNLTQYNGYISRSDMKYKANRLLKKLVDVEHSVHKIEIIDIEDYKIPKPDEFQKLIQIGYKDDECSTDIKEVKDHVEKGECGMFLQNTCDKCNLDYNNGKCEKCGEVDNYDNCDKCSERRSCHCNSQKVVVNYDRLKDLSNPQYRYGHMNWFYRYGGLGAGDIPVSGYHDGFQLIKCSSDPYFSIESHIKGCVNLLPITSQCETEYRIEPEVIRFNKKSGQVLLVYLANPTDDEGYMLVPDHPAVYDSIKWFIEEEFRYAQWANGDPSANALYKNAYQRKIEAMGIARAALRQQSFTEMWKELGKYYGKIMPVVDHRGNSVDHYEVVMNRIYRNF